MILTKKNIRKVKDLIEEGYAIMAAYNSRFEKGEIHLSDNEYSAIIPLVNAAMNQGVNDANVENLYDMLNVMFLCAYLMGKESVKNNS